jgi:hypothetical protein
MSHRRLYSFLHKPPLYKKNTDIEGASNTRNQLRITETRTKSTITNLGVQK